MQLHMSALCSVRFYSFSSKKELFKSVAIKAAKSPAIKRNYVNCNECLSML